MLQISLECGTETALVTINYQADCVNTSHQAEQIPQWYSGFNLTSQLKYSQLSHILRLIQEYLAVDTKYTIWS
jgi:hypothetical protein